MSHKAGKLKLFLVVASDKSGSVRRNKETNGMWFVLSGMLCFFIAHLADKYAKKIVADVTIFTGIFMIALAVLV